MDIWDYADWIAFFLQVFLAVLAIRVYRLKRTRAFGLLMAAGICYLFALRSVSAFGFVSGFIGHERESEQSATFFLLGQYTEFAFGWLVLISLLGALLSFLREHRKRATPTV